VGGPLVNVKGISKGDRRNSTTHPAVVGKRNKLRSTYGRTPGRGTARKRKKSTKRGSSLTATGKQVQKSPANGFNQKKKIVQGAAKKKPAPLGGGGTAKAWPKRVN